MLPRPRPTSGFPQRRDVGHDGRPRQWSNRLAAGCVLLHERATSWRQGALAMARPNHQEGK